MSSIRNPVGPQPSRVYWRRRLLVLLGVVAVIVIIVLIVGRPGGAPVPTPPPTSGKSSTSLSTGASTNAAGSTACDPAKVTVTAMTDSNSYAAGANPVLSFALKSSATTACTFLAGSDVQQFKVTSGDELIWNSKDCQTAPVAATVTLQPFIPLQGASLTWDRTRSSADTCNTARTPVTAGGASYHLQVIVSGVQSGSPQFLLK
jgi:hypothetical protein